MEFSADQAWFEAPALRAAVQWAEQEGVLGPPSDGRRTVRFGLAGSNSTSPCQPVLERSRC